jgi:DNA-binding NarL/FixJ family response regulator
MKLRVLLADDHAMVRKALRMLLEITPDIEVVGEAEDGQAVLDAVGTFSPDVICMDINMPGLNGIEATRQLVTAHAKVKVIGLSVHTDVALVADMIDAGASGYLVKSNAARELLQAIRQVSMEQKYFSPEVLSLLGRA